MRSSCSAWRGHEQSRWGFYGIASLPDGSVPVAAASGGRAAVSADAIRVLLVEDDLDIAAGLCEFLTAHQVECDFAVSAREAMHVLADTRFDVLVLDIHLPGEDGISLCRRLKSSSGGTAPVLFLTAQAGLDSKLDAFAAGGVDYVVKPFAPEELLARIRALVSHYRGPTSSALVVGSYRLDRRGHLLSHGELHLPLGDFGTRLLECLMSAWPASVAADTLASVLWGDQVPPSNPLRSHVHQLRRGFEKCFGQPLIDNRRGVGYRFNPDSP